MSTPKPHRSRPAKPDDARRAAFDLLRAVEERDAYANLVMPSLLDQYGLTDRDAGFATELGYGTLRMQGQHDAILTLNIDRPLAQIDPPVRSLLRLGVHQLHCMRVPSHAAVSATVELARAVAGESRASFVNAVLRSVGKMTHEEWLERIAQTHPSSRLAAVYSHPEWIVDAFRDALPNPEEIEALLEADNSPAGVTLAARDESAREDVLQRGGQPAAFLATALRWSGSLAALPGLGTPALGVQDEGSQLVVHALTRVQTHTDQAWLDMCAGPGGKSALLSAIAETRDPKISLLANEVSVHRADLVRPVVRANTTVQVGDGREVEGQFDRILIDAPCSGIGALRRRPEARWRRQASDVAVLRKLQRELLDHALDLLAPGGVVGYVTCSPHPAETVTIVEGALRGRNGFVLLDAATYLHEVPECAKGSYVQLWPHRHGTDGMFLALIQRRSD